MVYIRRLSWAGVEIAADGGRLLLDPLEDAAPLRDFLGAPRAPLAPVFVDGRAWAAVTHLHPDHCDRAVLGRLAPGHAVCHEPIAGRLGVAATPARLWETCPPGPSG